MGKFKKGVRVRLIEDHDGNATAGMVGVIVGKNEYGDRDVVFDNFTDGHSGEANDGSTNHWYVPKSKLEVVEEQPAAGLPFAVGDRVRLTAVNTHKHWGEAGETGVVQEVDIDIGARVAFERSGLWWAPFDLLEAKDAWVPKVGDRVRMAEDSPWYCECTQTVGTIVEADPNCDGIGAIFDGDDFKWHVEIEDIRLVDEPVAAEAQPAVAEETLTIQAGRYYKTRDGRKVGPVELWVGMEAFPGGGPLFHAPTDEASDGEYWQEDGTNGDDHSYRSTHLDLIAEWTEADEPVVAVEEVEPTKPEPKVGYRVWDVSGSGVEHNYATISAVNSDGEFTVDWDDGEKGESWWSVDDWDHIEPVAVAEVPAEPKFKIGDRVVRVKNGYRFSPIGHEAEVLQVDNDKIWFIDLDGDRLNSAIGNWELAPANDNTITLTLKVDSEPVADALRTIAAALSKAADEIAA